MVSNKHDPQNLWIKQGFHIMIDMNAVLFLLTYYYYIELCGMIIVHCNLIIVTSILHV